jgi:indolepyruvate ferredoxin oxidoreductase
LTYSGEGENAVPPETTTGTTTPELTVTHHGAPAAPVKLTRPETSLDDKYLLEQGTIFISGIQALVRVLLDQHRADKRRGLNTATFVSGYQGSPLGGFDKELLRLRKVADDHGIHFTPGLNEELAATSVYGSQLAMNLPGPKRDGVTGVWYGKNPGLDRAMDALRHANFAGTHPDGGALALVGDDPSCKSSTLPSAGEATLASLHMPTFFPGTLQEVLDFGLHAIACSRASGLWSALKIITNVADAAGTAQVWPERVAPVMPTVEDPTRPGKPYRHVRTATCSRRCRSTSSARCSARAWSSRASTPSSTSSTRSRCPRATPGWASSLRARSSTS